jgi:hypothetical protein
MNTKYDSHDESITIPLVEMVEVHSVEVEVERNDNGYRIVFPVQAWMWEPRLVMQTDGRIAIEISPDTLRELRREMNRYRDANQ